MRGVYKELMILTLMLRRSRSYDIPVELHIPSTQVLVSKYNSPLKGTRAAWRRAGLIPGLEQGKHKISLEVMVAPKSEKVLKESLKHRTQLNILHRPNLGQTETQNKSSNTI